MKLFKRVFRESWVVVFFTLCGVALRCISLGRASLQIDNLLFWDILNRNVTASQIFFDWMDLVGVTSQLSPVPAASRFFLDVFQLPVTFQTMILPFALCGSLAVPVAYMAGREFGGRRLAVVLAAVTAFNPLCIQMSREAYFYAPVFLGSFLALWAAGLSGRLLQSRPLPRYFHAVNAVAFLIMTWSSPSAWPWAFFFVSFNVALIGWQVVRYRRGLADLLIVVAVYGAIGLPLVLAPWGVKQLAEFTSDGATRDYWTKVFAVGREQSQWAKVWPVFCSYAWGITAVRQAFSALIILSGLAAFICGFRRKKTIAVLTVQFFVVLALNITAVEKSVWIFGVTRAVPLIPFFLLLLSAGLLFPLQLRRNRAATAGALFLILSGIGLWLGPDLLIPRMTGISRPYSEIARWADQNLPAGTPVLTDRFFTAYNEFRVHSPQKVQFVSTVPNQIPEQYNGLQFRKQTESFFEKYPDAAFYEEQHQWNHPEIGAWPEIRARFAKVYAVTNMAGYRLAKAGLFYRGEPDAPCIPEPFTATIYHNTTDDLISVAKRDGKSVLRLWGSGWGYAKPGWQQGDFRDYRLLGQAASSEIYNLTDAPLSGSLEVTAATAAAPKTVQAGSVTTVFAPGHLRPWSIPLTLQPGKNAVAFRSPSADPLFVLDIRWVPAGK